MKMDAIDQLTLQHWEGGLGLEGYQKLAVSLAKFQAAGVSSSREALLYLLLRTSPRGVRVSEVEKTLPCHQTMANNRLRALVDRGFAKRSGSRVEGYVYYATRQLREFVDGVFEVTLEKTKRRAG